MEPFTVLIIMIIVLSLFELAYALWIRHTRIQDEKHYAEMDRLVDMEIDQFRTDNKWWE